MIETSPTLDASGPAGADRADTPSATDSGVVLRLGGAHFVVAMSAVSEVVPLSTITRVPVRPEWLSGVMNWRGRILPVVDVRPLLGLDALPLPSSARLVVLSRDDVFVGLVAEAVPGVHAGDLDRPAASPPTLSPEAALLIRGQLTGNHRPLAVLDADAILGLRNRLDRDRRGSARPEGRPAGD